MSRDIEASGQPARILIVDDERSSRRLLEVMVTAQGYVPHTAASGEEALAMIAHQPPDLIVLDVMMPGMDGYQVAGQLKGDPLTENIPIIMITALDDREAKMLGLFAGAEDFLTKPVDRAELSARVRNLLRLKAYGDHHEDYSQKLELEVVARTAELIARTTAVEQMRAEQMRFKDEFMSHVSHELRSPLTAIKQFTSILLAGLAGELNKEQREYQEIVLRNIGQLQSMIDDLLEVTRFETGKLTLKPESVTVATAVTDTFDTLQGTAGVKGVTLSHTLPTDLPSAHTDQIRLRQILIILLDNAIKFTPAGGTVIVHAGVLSRDPRFLFVEVSDSGCGIDVETSERIFERLFQVSERTESSRKGLGLGLYICKELVARQGGEIRVKPHSPQGTTFSFTLPIFASGSVAASSHEIDENAAILAARKTAIESHAIPTGAYHE